MWIKHALEIEIEIPIFVSRAQGAQNHTGDDHGERYPIYPV
jgi:hypothetical protein